MNRFNPFRETNYAELQHNVSTLIADHAENIRTNFSIWLKNVRKKGNERITLMFIPHSEKKIVNFHISVFSIVITASIFVLVTVFTSLLILNHTSNVKEVDKLKLYGSDYKEQISHYKEEINNLYAVHKNLRDTVNGLHRIINSSSPDVQLLPDPKPDPLDVHNPDDPDDATKEAMKFEKIDSELKVSLEELQLFKKYIENRNKIIESTPSLWPVNGYVISPYGKRVSPDGNQQELSQGIDIAAFPGSEIHSSAPGKVESITWDSYYGLRIVISHKYGFTTTYSHCQRVIVEENQKVSKDEIIGYVGKTGKTSRYVTHYQVKIGTEYVDPTPYLNRISLDSQF